MAPAVLPPHVRVASLVPSATEICYALGVEPVGVSHECDHPPAAADRPTLVETRLDDDGGSAAVNEAVADAAAGDGLYRVRRDALAAADPDLVITQGVCDVCAVDDAAVRSVLDGVGVDAEVLVSHPHTLADVFEDVQRVGAAVGREDRAADLVAGLRDRVDAVRERAPGGDRPRAVVLDWMAPPMVAGHWVPELVEIAGGRHGLADPGDPAGPREWSAVREYDPEVLVAAPCGFSLDRTRERAHELIDRSGWEELTAVRDGRAHALDGHDYVNRPGPRLVDTLEYLAGLLHPDAFDAPPRGVVCPLDAEG